MPVSFTHLITPFVCAPDSEHGIACASLETALENARGAALEAKPLTHISMDHRDMQTAS
ncbi:hypothetical protein [Thiobacillus sp.]|uniref:hypothetical protein n=1 Tax=Thiobacillus sp. TaxID=924 RepID=UPI0025CCBC17|nr:hypothetical protein [Thiobacillus sp.]